MHSNRKNLCNAIRRTTFLGLAGVAAICLAAPPSTRTIDTESATENRAVDPAAGRPGSGIIFVRATADGRQDGSSWDDAYSSLQDALASAVAGQEIWVAAGMYLPDEGQQVESGDRTESFQVPDDVSLYGGFAGVEKYRRLCISDPRKTVPCQTDADCGGGQCGDVRDPQINATILSGDLQDNDDPTEFPGGPTFAENSFHVVQATGTTTRTRIDGFVISGGHANGDSFSDNRGGGIRISFGSPVIAGCTFIGNQATQSGGAVFTGIGDTTLIACNFVRNASTSGDGRGGALSGSLSRLHLLNCGFFGNTAGESGGAVYGNLLTNPLLVGCVFSGNQAARGGGLLSEFASSPVIINCTFGQNSASLLGGGVLLDGPSGLVRNSIFWNNSDSEGVTSDSQIRVTSETVEVDFSIIQGGWSGGSHIITDDPLFTNPAGDDGTIGTGDDDLRVLPGSPAIDAGDTSALPPDDRDLDNDGDSEERHPLDPDGNARVLDDPSTENTGVVAGKEGGEEIVDFGAYELEQDCNVNGLPDSIDIAMGISEDGNNDGIPDECGFWTGGCTDNSSWSCYDNWDLPGDLYPHNTESNTYSVVIGAGAAVKLDVDVMIDSLLFTGDLLDITDLQRALDVVNGGIVNKGLILLDNDASLSICCGGATAAEPIIEDPAGLENSGELTASGESLVIVDGGGLFNTGALTLNDAGLSVLDIHGVSTNGPFRVTESAVSDIPLGELKIGTNGVYEKAATSMPWTDASLSSNTVLITNADPEAFCPPMCGQPTMFLSNSMMVSTEGDFVLDGSATPAAVTLGIAPPPKLISTDMSVILIGGDLVLHGETQLDLQSGATSFGPTGYSVLLKGSLVNLSTSPELFEWTSPLRMGPASTQYFEAAGVDFGATLNGFEHPDGHTNFSMSSIEIADGAVVTFRNMFTNTTGSGPLDEVLYVESLTFGTGATVTVDATIVYYVTLADQGALINLVNDGALVKIPSVAAPEAADDAIDIYGQVQNCSTDRECTNEAVCLNESCYVPKQRYISVRANPENAGVMTARRVSLELEPGSSTELGWVGEPVMITLAGPGPSTALLSRLVDEPYFADWSALPLDVILVGDCAISPGHTYLVQPITLGLELDDEESFAPALALPTTAKFGDCCGGGIIQTPPDGIVSFVDILAAIKGFQSQQNAPRPWLDLVPYTAPNPSVVNFADIWQFGIAFRSGGYAGPAPLDCP